MRACGRSWPDLTPRQETVLAGLEKRLRDEHRLPSSDFNVWIDAMSSGFARGAVLVTVKFSPRPSLSWLAPLGSPTFELVITSGGRLLARRKDARRVSPLRGRIPRVC